MISTKSLLLKIQDVPSQWAFRYYLGLTEELTGQTIRMNSLFNKEDHTPSMYVYYDSSKNKYCFKDHSSGLYGDHIDLYKELFNEPSTSVAIHNILSDYNKFLKTNDYKAQQLIKHQNTAIFKACDKRKWNISDRKYWSQFNIGSKILEKYNVAGIENVIFEKEGREYIINDPHMYGYYNKDGRLDKIYRPFSTYKFHNVHSCTEGFDQLTFQKPYLVITSSRKDVMCLDSLKFRSLEFIAPNGEGNGLNPKVKKVIDEKYDKVCVLFDNDPAGIKGAMRYQELYGYPYVVLNLEKDPSDSVKEYGAEVTKTRLTELFSEYFITNKRCTNTELV